MAQPVFQKAFHTGELAPALFARVDLAKYHTAAATMRNFFVDYRGGASTRAGTKYVIQAKDSTKAVRLIPFAATSTTQYVLEFGDFYLRFIYAGSPVLETAKTITGITQANPGVVTSAAHGFSAGDVVYIAAVVGMTQVNGRYFKVGTTAANTFQLLDLNGANVNTTGYTAYSSGGTAARIYTITTPYAAADLALLKFAQNVNTMVLCHVNYSAYVLTLISAASWTLNPITYGASVATPTNFVPSGGAGGQNYNYACTAVDINGQESVAAVTPYASVSNSSITWTWTAVPGAQWYNIYRSPVNYSGVVPLGTLLGYIGYTSGLSYVDTLSATAGVPLTLADFSQTPPQGRNPFQGGPVTSVSVTAGGNYTTVPTVTIAAPTSGVQATAVATIRNNTTTLVAGGAGWSVNDLLTNATTGAVLQVLTIAGSAIATFQVVNRGTLNSGSTPTNPVSFTGIGSGATFNMTAWAVTAVTILTGGSGYSSSSPPAVTFSAGAAAATAVVDSPNVGNPAVPMFYNQRLALAGATGAPQGMFFSRPAAPYNFNVSFPAQPDDAITAYLTSRTLNSIKSMIPMATGLIVFSDQSAWLVNGGSAGAALTPIDFNAASQAYNGCSDVPPIVANFDVLYVQAKGSIVRDLSYNFYTNVFTGTDISVLSSHLFYGYTISEWAYAEEPFKVVWAVRSDGTLLSLTFLKEQELIGWARSDTSGSFKSVCTVTETVSFGKVDALYTVVERTINGNTVKYIERMAERIFPLGSDSAWSVDAGIQYNGTPTTSFQGAEHLAGATVTGVADGVAITPFTMPTNGFFTLASAASLVTIGIAFTPQLKTLPIDLGEPTVQGKRKKITAVDLKCQETLGLSIGKTFSTLTVMKDLVVGNVGSQTNEVVTDLVTGDARTIIDPSWDVPGQYCIQQSYPFPATILGVIPEVTVGDTPK